jgi:hypothetical protein
MPLTIADITEATVQFYGKEGEAAIKEGRATMFDHFNAAFAKATPEQREKLLDALGAAHDAL